MAKNIFISYKSVDTDTQIAEGFRSQLREVGFEVFMDFHSIRIGESWSDKIDEALDNSDYFLVLLSEYSLASDMVTEEIRKAKELFDTTGKPAILPVRINLPRNLRINYDISGYLNKIQNRFWQSETNTISIVKEIASLNQENLFVKKEEPNHSPPPIVVPENRIAVPIPNASLEIPGGTVRLDSPFYIERESEQQFIHNVLHPGSLLKIKGPRQFGKTSLMARIIKFSESNNHRVVALSFQLLGANSLKNIDTLLKQICYHASKKLGLPCKVKEYWEDDFIDSKMKATSYFEEYILQNIAEPILIAIDEADRVFEHPDVSSEFFGMLRYWHEEAKTRDVWRSVKIAIAHSTEAYLAISNLNQSPFNVGVGTVLNEFSLEQVSELVARHKLSLLHNEISFLHKLTGGHPFIVRKILYEIKENGLLLSELENSILSEDGPLDDHLSRNLWMINNNKELQTVLKEILTTNSTKNIIAANKLRAAGIVGGTTPKYRIRNTIYQLYLSKNMV